jgi:phosphate:Na+ symporter
MGESSFDFWKFVAGLGVFLFGMYHLELGLKGLAGSSFKKILKKFTNKSWKGIITGTFVTAILQSSSLVTLLVLAFLGGGMISLQNSLGVVLGANLGTTVTAWVVAALGFKMNVSDLSFPFLAIGALSYLMMDSRPVLKNLGSFLVGFGLLFLGLDFMKVAIEKLADQVDLTQYTNLGLWVFLLIGLIITALIQSSSAMIVIVLSALNSELIDVHQSVAMIIGASIGTTSTLILGSINGTADKKRLSLGNVIFKVVAGLIAFVFINQMVDFTVNYLNISDPLMELVLLNTIINIIGIIIFYPFLGPMGKFLKMLYRKSEPKGKSTFIKNVNPEVPDVALKALENELKQVFALTHDFILDCLRIREKGTRKVSAWKSIFSAEVNLIDRYNELKNIEDEITDYYTQIQEQNLTQSEADLTATYMMSLRSMIYSAKNIKDVISNIKEIDESEDALAQEILVKLQEFSTEKLTMLSSLFEQHEYKSDTLEFHLDFEKFYNQTVAFLYKNIKQQSKKTVPVSTTTNAIRKTVSALEDLASAVANRKLEADTMLEVEAGI